MQKLKTLFFNNRQDLFLLLCLNLIFLFFILFLNNYFGHLIVDCGNEAFFPSEMLQGKLYFKDFENPFGPLTYQINTLLFWIFGINLNILRLAGIVCSFFIICSLYCLSRFFLSKEICFISSLTLIFSCVLNPWIFNYIFPYSFSIVFALTFFLFSVLSLLLFLKKNNNYLLIISWFFIGFSFTLKYEYLFYIFLLAIITFLKNKEFKNIVFCLFVFLLPSIISYGLLFFQGLALKDFFLALISIKKLICSPAQNYFYKNFVGVYPNKILFLKAVNIFLYYAVLFFGSISSLYFLLNKNKTVKNIAIYSFLFYFFGIKLHFFVYNNANILFCWLPLFVLISFIFFLINIKKKETNKFFVLFVFIALLGSLKTFFFLNLNAYGTYSLPLLLIVFSAFITECFPEKIKTINKNNWNKAFFIVFLIISLTYILNLYNSFKDYLPLTTNRGSLYTSPEVAKPYQETIKYIEKNMNQNDKIWVIPEGIMLNFLTAHPSFIYTNLNIAAIEILGESNILKAIQKNPPKYVIFNNRESLEYGYKGLCKDYGLQICKYIKTSYTPVASFGSDFIMKIYKKN